MPPPSFAFLVRLRGVTASDLSQQSKEGALALGIQAPIDRRRLIAIDVIVCAGIEIAPGSVLAQSSDEIVLWLIEIEMVVLVEQDWLGSETGDSPRLAHHLGDSLGLGNTVAVQEQKIRSAHDVFARNGPAAIG